MVAFARVVVRTIRDFERAERVPLRADVRDERERELDEEWAAQWRAEELARRREEARLAKERAYAAQAAARPSTDPEENRP